MAYDNRLIKSMRISPSVTQKMNEISNYLKESNGYWGNNPHTQKLGYHYKSKISSADVLEIAVNKLHDELFPEEK